MPGTPLSRGLFQVGAVFLRQVPTFYTYTRRNTHIHMYTHPYTLTYIYMYISTSPYD